MLKKEYGITLIELMIVVAIIAIIASIAIPSYEGHVQKTRRSDGQAKLMEVMSNLERHYSLNNTYVVNLSTLAAYTTNPVTSDESYYQISAEACGSSIANCVKLTAAPQGAQANDTKCASLTYDSRGEKGETGSGSRNDCW